MVGEGGATMSAGERLELSIETRMLWGSETCLILRISLLFGSLTYLLMWLACIPYKEAKAVPPSLSPRQKS